MRSEERSENNAGGVDTASRARQTCEHANLVCACNKTDAERAELLSEYLDALSEVGWSNLRLMPLDGEGKAPKIARFGVSLDSERARELLHTPDEAVDAVRNGARGFALYAGREEHGTEGLVFTDHDDTDLWPPSDTPDSLLVTSGSGEGNHKTHRNSGGVQNSKATNELKGAGEVRAENWYVVVPGSVHPSGGIYHMTKNPGIAPLRPEDLPPELRPASATDGSAERTDPEPGDSRTIKELPEGFDADSVTNSWNVRLGDVRMASRKLDCLLTEFNPDPSTYPSTSEADMATVSLLLVWGFEVDDIADILRAERSREKIRRADYVWRTITRTALTEMRPVDPDLGRALVESAKENGGRPKAGNLTLRNVSHALSVKSKATVSQLVDGALIPWGDAKRDSVKSRTRRALKILERAGYVSREERTPQVTVWHNERLDSMDLPDDY